MSSAGNPSGYGVNGGGVEGMGYPAVYDIPRDRREQMNQVDTNVWVIASCMKIIGAYQHAPGEHANPAGFSLTES